MGFKDILTDNSKILEIEVDGIKIPFRKLTVEQMTFIEKRFEKIEDLIKEKLLLRLQNADPMITMSDIDRMTEDQYLKVIVEMNKALEKSNRDFSKKPIKKD